MEEVVSVRLGPDVGQAPMPSATEPAVSAPEPAPPAPEPVGASASAAPSVPPSGNEAYDDVPVVPSVMPSATDGQTETSTPPADEPPVGVSSKKASARSTAVATADSESDLSGDLPSRKGDTPIVPSDVEWEMGLWDMRVHASKALAADVAARSRKPDKVFASRRVYRHKYDDDWALVRCLSSRKYKRDLRERDRFVRADDATAPLPKRRSFVLCLWSALAVTVALLAIFAAISAFCFYFSVQRASPQACASPSPSAASCTTLEPVDVWTNCAAECRADFKLTTRLPFDESTCKVARWRACDSQGACSPTLRCPQTWRLANGTSGVGADCAPTTTYCYAFAAVQPTPSSSYSVHVGCYSIDASMMATDHLCGEQVANGTDCQAATVGLQSSGQNVTESGHLCCCRHDNCGPSTTSPLVKQPFRCSIGNYSDACSADDECEDFDYNDVIGPHPGQGGCGKNDSKGQLLVKLFHALCAAGLPSDMGCFRSATRELCCCDGVDCHNSTTAIEQTEPTRQVAFSCTTDGAACDTAGDCYALLGDGDDEPERGCVDGLTRVPPLAVAAACRMLKGCFVTADVGGRNVSVCCCRGHLCEPDDVRAFVGRGGTTPAQTDCGSTAATLSWPLFVAGGAFAVVAASLLIPAVILVFLLCQFSVWREDKRWGRFKTSVETATLQRFGTR